MSLYSVLGDIGGFLKPDVSEEARIQDRTSSSKVGELTPIEVPKVEQLRPGSATPRRDGTFAVADVTIGAPLLESIQRIVSRDKTCSEISVKDRAWTGITVTAAKQDPVFQSPRVVECYRSGDHFEHIYLFPDIYETKKAVFAVARVSTLKKLEVSDLRELLEHRYGSAREPGYQPNYGMHLRWLAGRAEQKVVERDGCFLYLPRAMKTSLEYSPVAGRQGVSAKAQLNSYELKDNCGLVLNAFIQKRDRRVWLFLRA